MKRFIFMLMAAVMLMGGTISAYAMEYPSSLPPLPEVSDSLSVVYKIGNTTYTVIVSQSSLIDYSQFITWEQTIDNSKSLTMFLNNAPVALNYLKKYTYTLNGSQWQHFSTNEYSLTGSQPVSLILPNSDIKYLYSDLDIIDIETRELVFPVPPVPLAEEIRVLTEETMTAETMPELTRTVLVVALCGVGCLALVISLPLLKKVFSRFLA